MFTRRAITRGLTASALSCLFAPALIKAGSAQNLGATFTPVKRGSYLIRNGAVITVDPATGTLPRADVLIRDGRIAQIGASIEAPDAEVIDATDMIVMPGLIDTHYHMWSALARSFTGDNGFGYFPAKNAVSPIYTPEDSYRSVMLGLVELANNGVTTVHNWSNNTRTPAHADAELRAHRDAMVRARFAYGHPDLLDQTKLIDFSDIDRVQDQWFGKTSPFEGVVHLGVNLRGMSQSKEAIFHEEMGLVMKRGLPCAIHAGQSPPNVNNATDYEKRGYLGPNLLIAHYVVGDDSDFEALARTKTPLSFATVSEMRLGKAGDYRAALMRMRRAGLTLSLSVDASLIAPPNMFELMRTTWNLGVPWQGTPSADQKPIGYSEIIRMATINGAIGLGLGEVTGSLTVGKRADVILVRMNDINTAPMGQIETAVVQSAAPENVDTVLIDGRVVKRDGKLVAYDVKRIVTEAKDSAKRLRTAAGGALLPPACPTCGG